MTPHHRGYDQPSAHAEATPTRRLRLVLAPRAVTATVWAARLAGLLTLASVISPLLRRRVRPESWFDLPAATSLAASVVLAAAGSGLMLLAIGLRRRKRRAWQLGAALCVLIIVSHAVGRHPLVPLVVAAVLLVGLVITRREFTALPDPVDRLVALRVVVQLLAAGFLIVTLLLLLVRPALLEGRPSVGERLAQAALSLIGVSGPVAFRAPWLDDLTAGIGLTFGVGALVLGGYFLLRSAEPRPALTPDDVDGIRGLLAKHGRADSLGYFALRSDGDLRRVRPTGAGEPGGRHRRRARQARLHGHRPLGPTLQLENDLPPALTTPAPSYCNDAGSLIVIGRSRSPARHLERRGRTTGRLMPQGMSGRVVGRPVVDHYGLVGQKFYDVTSSSRPRTSPVPHATGTIRPGQNCKPSSGVDGFTITDMRTLRDLRNGQVRTEPRTVRYDPEPDIRCG